MECQICRRQTKAEFPLCRFHFFALKRILRRYETWRVAAEVGWGECLKRVDANPATGVWVREVISWIAAKRMSEDALEALVRSATPAPQGS